MKYFNFIINVSLVVAACAVPFSAKAYLDPGTGSYFLQLLAGGLFGGLYAAKVWRNVIVSNTRGMFKKN